MGNKIDYYLAQWFFSTIVLLYFNILVQGHKTIDIVQLTTTVIIALVGMVLWHGMKKLIK